MPTIRSYLNELGLSDWIDDSGNVDHTLFRWPPDLFAATACILKDSGAYIQCTRPRDYSAIEFDLDTWRLKSKQVSEEWRQINVDRHDATPPEYVCQLLDKIAEMADRDLTVLTIPDKNNIHWIPFVKLMCISDQACRGVGNTPLPFKDDSSDNNDNIFLSMSMTALVEQMQEFTKPGGNLAQFAPSTLCKRIDKARAVVLPKMRTSQRGATIRSLSLYLALLTGSDLEPHWHQPDQLVLPSQSCPSGIKNSETTSVRVSDLIEASGPYNFILLPWPFHIIDSQFSPIACPRNDLGHRPPPGHGLFEYSPLSGISNDINGFIKELITEAKRRVGYVHGIVLPEMALTREDFEQVFNEKNHTDLEVVACGVYEPSPQAGGLAKNYTIVRTRAKDGKGFAFTVQEKHHRWALDPAQVKMYGLASVLKPTQTWWEGIELPRRSLNFFSLDAMAAYSVLVCEDLARPDPVADAIRAIGPNFVICLLMDGPQLASRWSGRYATVLADDPGSSVLTLSSLGMVERSRLRDRIQHPSRIVALWREPGEAPIELELESSSSGLLLTMYPSHNKEYTLDGRDDDGIGTSLRLASVTQLKEPRPNIDVAAALGHSPRTDPTVQ